MYTDAEMRVIKELIQGHDNITIAKNIGCAVKTVKFHLHKINKKSNTKTRCQFISQYYRACLKNERIETDYSTLESGTVEGLFKSLNCDPDILPRGRAS